MAFDSSKTSGKVLKVLLAVVLAVALIPVSALFGTGSRVSALEGGGAEVAAAVEGLQDGSASAEGEASGGADLLSEDPEQLDAYGDLSNSNLEKHGPLDSDEGLDSASPSDASDPGGPGMANGSAHEGAATGASEDGISDGLTSESDGVPGAEAAPQVGELAGAGEVDAGKGVSSGTSDALAFEEEGVGSESPKASSEVSFSVEGQGSVEIRTPEGEVYVVDSGGNLVLEQPVGSYVSLFGKPAEGRELSAVISVVDAQTRAKVEDELRFEVADFEKDLTFSPSGKSVKIVFEQREGESSDSEEALFEARPLMLRAAQAGNASQPEVGDRFTGVAQVKARNIVSAGGRVADITVDPTSGILAELSSLTTYCAHHTAAAPLVGFTYSYTFTVTSVNKETGEVRGTFYGTSWTSPTDGVTRDGRGRLTGYQALEGEAVLWRTYARGGISVSKTLVGGSASELEGIAFEVYDEGGNKKSFPLPDGTVTDRLVLDENGRAQTASNALLAGTYSLVELDSSVPDGVISHARAEGDGSNVVAWVNISAHHALYPVEVRNYKKPQLGLIKLDGDSLAEATGQGPDPQRVEGSLWSLEFKGESGWTELERHETDGEGRIEFSDQAISQWGRYRLVEIEASQSESPDGYMGLEDSAGSSYVEFTVDASTWTKAEQGAFEGELGDSWEFSLVEGRPALVHTVSNWRYRDIEVIKLDEQTGDPLSQTEYSLWRFVGEGEPLELEQETEWHETYLENPSAQLDPDLWELVAQGETDDQGSVLFRGLTFGFYLVVEELPNPAYAEWWESSESSWGAYCLEVGEAEQRQVQVFENMKITLETTVDKSTITQTSAAFRSLPGQNVSFDNVGFERYRYDVAFTNGSTNVRADQYTVVDECDFVELGIRLSELWTPVVAKDTDTRFNLWFQTNKTDPQAVYSTVSATASNPENKRADGTDRISTIGWRLWSANLPAAERTQLSVADLGLAEGEYITGLLLEYGSVEVGFETEEPLTYLVYATEQLMDDELILNSVSSHITRNWRSGALQGLDGSEVPDGLYDDAYDRVQTTVLETMSYEPGESTWKGSVAQLSQTGDSLAASIACLIAVGAFGVLIAALALRRQRGSIGEEKR